MSQGVNKPGGERARGRTSQGANKARGERARGQISKGAKKPDTLQCVSNINI